MRTPIIGRGFGHFSRILGPWADWPAGFRLDPQTPFGLALGTIIEGGATGAIVSAITVEPPANQLGTNGPNDRVIVLVGDTPGNLVPYQHTERGWPDTGESAQASPVLWSKIFATKTVSDNVASSNQNEHFPFPKFSGPQVGPGERMAVLYLITSDEPSTPGYGVAIRTFMSMTVLGHYGRPKADNVDVASIGRSIPLGVMG